MLANKSAKKNITMRLESSEFNQELLQLHELLTLIDWKDFKKCYPPKRLIRVNIIFLSRNWEHNTKKEKRRELEEEVVEDIEEEVEDIEEEAEEAWISQAKYA